MKNIDAIKGCLFGTAAGDAIGLPFEGLSRGRVQRMLKGKPLGHRLVFGCGMCSDDTEHTVMAMQSFMEVEGDADDFAYAFARRLRWWFLRVPAGVGLATLRACVKLWLGFRPSSSGVHSAGNGPAMRSAILGVLASSPEQMEKLVTASTMLTHTDSRALEGAMVIAAAARWATENDGDVESKDIRDVLMSYVNDEELKNNMRCVFTAVDKGMTAAQLADQLRLYKGVTGYISHTVPVAVFCWLRYRGSFEQTIEAAVLLGGDTDTVAAIAGAVAGAELGCSAIPEKWIDGMADWPCTAVWMDELAKACARSAKGESLDRIPSLSPALVLGRNVIFAVIVLLHGFRRLLPPY